MSDFYPKCVLLPHMCPFTPNVSFYLICVLLPHMCPFTSYVSFFYFLLGYFYKKNCEWVFKFFPFTVRKYWIAAQILCVYTVYLPLACVYTTFSDLRVFIPVHLRSSVVAFPFPTPERGPGQ